MNMRLGDAVLVSIGGILLLSTINSCLNDVMLVKGGEESSPTFTVAVPSPTPEDLPPSVNYTYDHDTRTLSCPEADARTLYDVDANGHLDYVCVWSCATYDIPPFPSALFPGPDHVFVVAWGGIAEEYLPLHALGHGGLNHCHPATQSVYYLEGTPQP